MRPMKFLVAICTKIMKMRFLLYSARLQLSGSTICEFQHVPFWTVMFLSNVVCYGHMRFPSAMWHQTCSIFFPTFPFTHACDLCSFVIVMWIDYSVLIFYWMIGAVVAAHAKFACPAEADRQAQCLLMPQTESSPYRLYFFIRVFSWYILGITLHPLASKLLTHHIYLYRHMDTVESVGDSPSATELHAMHFVHGL